MRRIFANFPVSDETIEATALARAWIAGRMQFIPFAAPGRGYAPSALGWPPLLLDGAHNPHGLAALGLALARQGIAPAAVIFTCMDDKDLGNMLPHLRSLATGPIFVPPLKDNPRAMPPEMLAALIGVGAEPVASLRDALQKAATLMAERIPESFAPGDPRNPLLVCGSLYLLGELYALRPDCLEEIP